MAIAQAGAQTAASPPPSPPLPPLPPPAPTWDWQLSPPLRLDRRVKILDLDPDLVAPARLRELKARGVYLVCYVSVGTWEDWRADSRAFPRHLRGRPYAGWPGERFLDIRRTGLLLPIMKARFRRCRRLGFDAVEADNIDIYTMPTGFPLTKAHALAYARLLAAAAHELGLAIAQKNAPDLTPRLLTVMDFAIAEECFSQGWCARMRPWTQRGRPVLAAEYRPPEALPGACRKARRLGISLIFKDRDLTGNRYRACPLPRHRGQPPRR